MKSGHCVLAAARALGERFAQATNTNKDDVWAIYAEQLRGDAAAALEAAGMPDLVRALVKLADAVETRKPEHEGYLVLCAQEARAAVAKATGSAA